MIYIIKHKEYKTPKIKGYKELYVGELYKDTKDNINELNPYINEATGLYDIWKHGKDKIVGLVHYRRYFVHNGDYLSINTAEKILKDHDIIITPNVVFERGIYDQLRTEMPNSEEALILDKYYNKLCEIEPGLKEYFQEREFAPKEMFVCKREILNNYCEWLFKLIIPITKQFVEEDSQIIQKRMIGHLVERLFYYWIKNNKLRTYVMDYKQIEG